MHFFHYHLVTSQLRNVEARYVGRLGFRLVARYGRIGEEHLTVEAGVPWEKLDADGFKLRLSELERGMVNVVIQPGHWEIPRVDHLGVALDDEEFQAVLARANDWNLRIQEPVVVARSSRRTRATGLRFIRRATGLTRCSRRVASSSSRSCNCAPTSLT